MTTLSHQHFANPDVGRTGLTRPASAPGADATTPKPIPARELEARLEQTGIRAVVWISAGVFLVSCILAIVLLGWEMALIGGLGITLTALLFGSPFWIAAIIDAVDQEHTRLTGRNGH